jgi:N-acetylmuramoyl-L-alanine amidase CwlA
MQINKDYPCKSTNYRKGRRDSIKYIVIHYVGATGSALNNVKYYSTSYVGASAHYYVGHASENGAIYQSVAPENCAWHCGSETGIYYNECRNDSAIGIEMCCHKDENGNWYFDDITVEKTLELTKWLMKEYDIPGKNVIRHYDVTRKQCPAPFVVNWKKWEVFKSELLKEDIDVPKTVYSINDVHVQVILPDKFKIKVVDEKKQNIKENNYANAGFFANADSGTIPVGHLVVGGKVITNAKTQADWLNTARHEHTTIVVYSDDTVAVIKTADIESIQNVKYAISGIPIIRNGYKVSMDEIKSEGYFGNECYWTWHGFLGVRHGKLVYVASETDFDMMPYLMEVLGITDAIKLDGGGSFILHNGKFRVATDENRKINNIITWEG